MELRKLFYSADEKRLLQLSLEVFSISGLVFSLLGKGGKAIKIVFKMVTGKAIQYL